MDNIDDTQQILNSEVKEGLPNYNFGENYFPIVPFLKNQNNNNYIEQQQVINQTPENIKDILYSKSKVEMKEDSNNNQNTKDTVPTNNINNDIKNDLKIENNKNNKDNIVDDDDDDLPIDYEMYFQSIQNEYISKSAKNYCPVCSCPFSNHIQIQ